MSWKNYATPVKDQRKCAACYAFSALASLELNMNKDLNQYASLSEQEIIDCSKTNRGCIGGNPSLVYDYINRNGINFANSYPYVGKQNEQCKNYSRTKFKKRIQYFGVHNKVELIQALNVGPVVLVHHVNKNFKRYSNGIFNDSSCKGKLNHSTLAVGYNLSHETPHLIVKNGWGTGWGDNGYFKIALGDVTANSPSLCSMFDHNATVLISLS